MSSGVRVALLCHSTHPRGGVAHALALGDALHDAGCDVTVLAPDAAGGGFPQPTRCRTAPFAAAAVSGPLIDLVRVRAAEFRAALDARAGAFDVIHAHDALSGSVLADAVADGYPAAFVRTVHHLDSFADAELAARQARSVTAADACMCVSHATLDDVRHRYGRTATVIGNGVDRVHFSPTPGPRDAYWAARLAKTGPLYLAVGGIEARKNSVRLLQAFERLHAGQPTARLAVVGGASLLDHSATRRAFDAALVAAGPAVGAAVDVVGVVGHDDMPALYRTADVLAFPSLHEGYGLAVLEAMACGTPVVAPRAAPFTEYLDAADAAGCDPTCVESIAAAMARAADPAAAVAFRQRGLAVAARHSWPAMAAAHLGIYRRIFAGAVLCPR